MTKGGLCPDTLQIGFECVSCAAPGTYIETADIQSGIITGNYTAAFTDASGQAYMASFNVGFSDCFWLSMGATEYSVNNFVIVPAGPPPGMTDASPVIRGHDTVVRVVVLHRHAPGAARALQALLFRGNA